MNQRIRELAEQAGIVKILDEHAHEYGNGMFENTPYPELEKFAELIVGEFLSYGKLTQSQPVVNGSEEYNAGREMGIEVFMNQIKQHFGVEG